MVTIEAYSNLIPLFASLDLAVDVFDTLFSLVAPTQLSRYAVSSESSSTKTAALGDCLIPLSGLSPTQCEAIKCLSGHLSAAKRASDLYRFYCDEGSVADDAAKIKVLENLLTEKTKIERLDAKKICTLQDFLVSEVNRSDGLETVLKDKEKELVKLSEEFKKLSQNLRESRIFNASSTTDQPLNISNNRYSINTVPEASNTARAAVASKTNDFGDISEYLGAFIRKDFGKNGSFFGVIVAYDHPYYKVVYEDADQEELTRHDVKKLLWEHTIPAVSMNRCRRHAKTLGGPGAIAVIESRLGSAGLVVTEANLSMQQLPTDSAQMSQCFSVPASAWINDSSERDKPQLLGEVMGDSQHHLGYSSNGKRHDGDGDGNQSADILNFKEVKADSSSKPPSRSEGNLSLAVAVEDDEEDMLAQGGQWEPSKSPACQVHVPANVKQYSDPIVGVVVESTGKAQQKIGKRASSAELIGEDEKTTHAEGINLTREIPGVSHPPPLGEINSGNNDTAASFSKKSRFN